MPGPAPLPTEIKKATGNRGKRPLNDQEPSPENLDDKSPPEWLDDIAKEEWARVLPVLEKNKVLTEMDVSALEGYCRAYSILREASEDIKEIGLLVTGDNGISYQNPNLKIVTEYSKIVKGFLQEFGMTPASRTRVKVEKEGKGKSSFDKI